jgi:hypothetical protein
LIVPLQRRTRLSIARLLVGRWRLRFLAGRVDTIANPANAATLTTASCSSTTPRRDLALRPADVSAYEKFAGNV